MARHWAGCITGRDHAILVRRGSWRAEASLLLPFELGTDLGQPTDSVLRIYWTNAPACRYDSRLCVLAMTTGGILSRYVGKRLGPR